jgi:hypothetical protein
VQNPGVLMVSCAYCATAIYWDNQKISAAGFKSALQEGYSRLYRGATGSLLNKRFIVMGRARYTFVRGFWDEWHLEMQDGSMLWLTEDNHELRVEKEITGVEVPPAGKCGVGMRIRAGADTFIVTETGVARCAGMEGSLPKVLTPDEEYPFADASSQDGARSLGIEYDDDPPAVFYGDWLNPASLKMDDEGNDW